MTRIDWRNLIFMTGTYIVLVLFLSPNREYSVIDDWIYAQAARHVQVLGWYARPDWSVASLVAQAWWGSAFATVFGYCLTTLTYSTLVLAWIGVLCFYRILRLVGVTAGVALFGALLLLLNPVYLHLGYSFMTDVPFVALLLASTLCALLGLQRDDDWLLLAAMLLSGLAALVRQPGIIVAGALFGYLVLSRGLTRRRTAIVLIPVLIVGIYLIWDQAQPLPPAIAAYTSGPEIASTANTGLVFAVVKGFFRALLILPALGLWLLPLAAVTFRVHLRPAAWALAGGLALLMVYTYRQIPAKQMLMPLDYTASVLTSHGFWIFNDSIPPPVLTPAAWAVISVIMIALSAWLLVALATRLVARLRLLLIRPASVALIDFVYLGGALVGLAGVFGVQLYDRYLLPLLPFLVIWLLRRCAGFGRVAWVGAIALLLAVGGFSILAQADFADRAVAHWTAGNMLLARGIRYSDLTGGYEWNGMHYYDDLGNRRPDSRDFHPGQLADLPYMLSDTPHKGYHEVGRIPYFSRLGGFTWRTVLMLGRDGTTRAEDNRSIRPAECGVPDSLWGSTRPTQAE
jgi:hypothetical protein